MTNFKNKYLKYKKKYLTLKGQIGGNPILPDIIIPFRRDIFDINNTANKELCDFLKINIASFYRPNSLENSFFYKIICGDMVEVFPLLFGLIKNIHILNDIINNIEELKTWSDEGILSYSLFEIILIIFNTLNNKINNLDYNEEYYTFIQENLDREILTDITIIQSLCFTMRNLYIVKDSPANILSFDLLFCKDLSEQKGQEEEQEQKGQEEGQEELVDPFETTILEKKNINDDNYDELAKFYTTLKNKKESHIEKLINKNYSDMEQPWIREHLQSEYIIQQKDIHKLLNFNHPGNIACHVNSIIVDKNRKEIIRWEPHGGIESFYNHEDLQCLKNILIKLLNLDNEYKYITNNTFCPHLTGVQGLGKTIRGFDLCDGLCNFFSSLMTTLRFLNPSINIPTIQRYILLDSENYILNYLSTLIQIVLCCFYFYIGIKTYNQIINENIPTEFNIQNFKTDINKIITNFSLNDSNIDVGSFNSNILNKNNILLEAFENLQLYLNTNTTTPGSINIFKSDNLSEYYIDKLVLQLRETQDIDSTINILKENMTNIFELDENIINNIIDFELNLLFFDNIHVDIKENIYINNNDFKKNYLYTQSLLMTNLSSLYVIKRFEEEKIQKQQEEIFDKLHKINNLFKQSEYQQNYRDFRENVKKYFDLELD